MAAWWALLISALNAIYMLWDRLPHAKVSISKEVSDHETGDERLWVNIANRSTQKIFVTVIYAEWSRQVFLPFGRHRIEIHDLQRWENENAESIARFWIEAWGNVELSAEAFDIEYDLIKRLSFWKPAISYRVVIRDGIGRYIRSNEVTLKKPGIGSKLYLQLLWNKYIRHGQD